MSIYIYIILYINSFFAKRSDVFSGPLGMDVVFHCVSTFLFLALKQHRISSLIEDQAFGRAKLQKRYLKPRPRPRCKNSANFAARISGVSIGK